MMAAAGGGRAGAKKNINKAIAHLAEDYQPAARNNLAK